MPGGTAEDDISAGYRPGLIGGVAALHGVYYAREWDFGAYFEAKVARELAAFAARYDPDRDRIFSVWKGESLLASLTIDGLHAADRGAHLRWFIAADAARGTGVGGRLMVRAMDFCRARGYREVYLWTFAGLDAARTLYLRAGFELAEARRGAQWGREVEEQRYVANLAAAGHDSEPQR